MGGLSIWHLIILVIVLPLTFAPTIIAFMRHHNYKWIVLAVQILLSWTGIGWIAALIWAIVGKTSDQSPPVDEVFR
jgi:ABC-type transport system involved in cytochrome c biogenesis permease component